MDGEHEKENGIRGYFDWRLDTNGDSRACSMDCSENPSSFNVPVIVSLLAIVCRLECTLYSLLSKDDQVFAKLYAVLLFVESQVRGTSII